MIIDQFEQQCTVLDAMDRFADGFGDSREVDEESIRPDPASVDATLFGLVDGVRTYRIENVNGVWTITLWEPTT